MSKEQKYWDERSKKWLEDSYGKNAKGNFVRFKIVDDFLKNIKGKKVLDAGCGAGYLLKHLLDNKYNARGIDFSKGMVKTTKNLLIENNYDPKRASLGSVKDLSQFKNAEFDVVILTGVLQYIKNHKKVYDECHRILKKNGVLISSNQNEFFDLTTFNRYTINFFANNFSNLISGSKKAKSNYKKNLKKLISFPNEPKKHGTLSARDRVEVYSKNPLEIGKDLKISGFNLISGPSYYSLHFYPPLLNKNSDIKFNTRKQFELRNNWQSMFLGSQFITKAKKYN